MAHHKKATVVRQSVTIEAVQRTLSSHYGVTIEQICAPGKDARLIRIRQVGAWLARTVTDAPTTEVVRTFGLGRFSVLRSAYAIVERRRHADKSFCEEMQTLMRMLKNE